ncbi:1-(5-phosphoribosyl)-5-[(5-phosphoribosylamino)methylideneamino]imidazole-4-carboxamide isomerase [Legionella taurinensis]|nr:1-(5-phosphoribosyl)-5-[(5-phosphoribosylamino)methylideneamino]imidazole-4-carboxamide isomerase [Legionella taurinensis]
MMLLIPAIDIQQGHCVRLQQGDFSKTTIYPKLPQALAQHYCQQGARRLHIVDLDGAQSGAIQQLSVIKALQTVGARLQVGGGIRRLAAAQACLELGVSELVIGSIAVSDPAKASQIIHYCGAENIVLAVDVRLVDGIPRPAIHGWQTDTALSLWEVIEQYRQQGVKQVLCTDIAKDGMMSGPNFALYEEAIQRFPDIAWQASGGIRHHQDLNRLKAIGLSAAILGRLLYETDFDLRTALMEAVVC